MPPQSAADWKNRGNQLFAEGRATDAIAAYAQGIDCVEAAKGADPDKVLHILHSNSAQAYLSLDDNEKACAAASRAIEANTTFPKSYLRRAKALMLLGRHEEAVEDCDTLLSLAPEMRDEAESMKRQLQGIIAAGHRAKRDAAKAEKRVKSVSAPAPTPASYAAGPAHNIVEANSTRALGPGPDPDRPSLESCIAAHKDHTRLRFFPAGPVWLDEGRCAIVPAIQAQMDHSGLPLGMFLSNFVTQIRADREYRQGVAKCDRCDKDLRHLLPSPPQCLCGELYCSPECHKKDWKNHRSICNTVEENNAIAFTMSTRFWMEVSQGRISWDPARPTVVPAPNAEFTPGNIAESQATELTALLNADAHLFFSVPEYRAMRDGLLRRIRETTRDFNQEAADAMSRGMYEAHYDFFDAVERPFLRDSLADWKAERDRALSAKMKANLTTAGRYALMRDAAIGNVALATAIAEYYLELLEGAPTELLQTRGLFHLTVVGNAYRVIDQVTGQTDQFDAVFAFFKKGVVAPHLERIAAAMRASSPDAKGVSGKDLAKFIEIAHNNEGGLQGDPLTRTPQQRRQVGDLRNSFYSMFGSS